ncbi:hypothetical protein BDZ91DRAFT_761807 [Kalaharituber pfeilii]|nr:hypothetical protein BDZ91DRAFT_761807 [Kalaharituber pfeilii]
MFAKWSLLNLAIPHSRASCRGTAISILRRKDGAREVEDKVLVRGLRLVTVIGVNLWEREGHTIVVNFTLHKPMNCSAPKNVEGVFDTHYDYRKVAKVVTECVGRSSYKTVEALATAVARVCLEVTWVTELNELEVRLRSWTDGVTQ